MQRRQVVEPARPRRLERPRRERRRRSLVAAPPCGPRALEQDAPLVARRHLPLLVLLVGRERFLGSRRIAVARLVERRAAAAPPPRSRARPPASRRAPGRRARRLGSSRRISEHAASTTSSSPLPGSYPPCCSASRNRCVATAASRRTVASCAPTQAAYASERAVAERATGRLGLAQGGVGLREVAGVGRDLGAERQPRRAVGRRTRQAGERLGHGARRGLQLARVEAEAEREHAAAPRHASASRPPRRRAPRPPRGRPRRRDPRAPTPGPRAATSARPRASDLGRARHAVAAPRRERLGMRS